MGKFFSFKLQKS